MLHVLALAAGLVSSASYLSSDAPLRLPRSAEHARELFNETTAAIEQLEAEYQEADLGLPAIKLALAVLSLGLSPLFFRYGSGTEGLVLVTSLIVSGIGFGIAGIVQLILRIGARARLAGQLFERQSYLEKLKGWGRQSEAQASP